MADGPKKEGGDGEGTPPAADDPQAWARFERTVGRMLRTPPQPRKGKGEEARNHRSPERREPN